MLYSILLTVFLAINIYFKRTKGDFQGSNVVIIKDFDFQRQSFGKMLISNILNKLPLDKYRVSLYSTNGVLQQFQDFQSRTCLVNILVNETTKKRSMISTLKLAKQEIEADLSDERNIIIVIVDEDLDESAFEFLKSTRVSTLNIGVYILCVSQNISKFQFRKEVGFQWVYVNSTSVIKNLSFLRENRQSCGKTSIALDECNRLCDCIDSMMVNCKRVRKEFSSMPKEERNLYLNVLKELSTNRKYFKIYQQFIDLHSKYFDSGIHEDGQFCPWHRSYILKFENLLRMIDCRVTIPVWNWASYSHVIWKSTPTYHMWDDDGGFGSDGDKNIAYCVGKGEEEEITAESNKCFETSRLPIYNKCLRRRFNGVVPNISEIIDVMIKIKPENFLTFENTLRRLWHNKVHNRIGGHMQTQYAAYSPEFWSHHAMLDAIWSKWQEKCKNCIKNSITESELRLIGFNTYRRHYLDISAQGECGVHVMYDQIFDISFE
ncbi:uncharacterized protein LOC105843588 isoform X2 [Hydra vulgaris]|uniref:uncharacterized protein LOC105843588 isoform X2 n=1 Tax=Hydra vulgaris TaxID=6087 RepID=UPI001F5E4A93|nr:uncharacterized protein LOC105843588 isoform X2 [Hydra vulgaris]